MLRSIISILLFVLFQLVGFLGVALFLTGSVNGDFSGELLVSITIWGSYLSYLLLFLTLWALHFFKPSDITKKLPLKALLLSVVMSLLLIMPISELNSAFELSNRLGDLFKQITQSLWGILIIAVCGPVIEEIVFRRIIIDDFMKRFGKQWVAIVVSSALFGLIHMNPVQMLSGFLIGLALGWTYCRTGSILPGILVHIINNSIGVLEMRCSENGWSLSPDGVKFYQNPWSLLIFTSSIILAFVLAAALNRFYSQKSQLQSNCSSVKSIE